MPECVTKHVEDVETDTDGAGNVPEVPAKQDLRAEGVARRLHHPIWPRLKLLPPGRDDDERGEMMRAEPMTRWFVAGVIVAGLAFAVSAAVAVEDAKDIQKHERRLQADVRQLI